MKKKLHTRLMRNFVVAGLTFIFTFTCLISFAQKETNNWHFGYNSGLDFNSGYPVSVSTSSCNTSEGSASLSDTAGNLLFYTDGITVWNKNNSIMFNGTGLFGDFSSSQSALIVSWPGSDSLFYIFTVDEQTTINGLEYSIVDMSQQSGLGAVIVKNIMVKTPTTEKLTAVCQPNGIDYWIITHDWNNNNFLAYSLTASGISNTPVTSSIGSIATGSDWNAIGYLKASPNGTKIAQAIWGNNYFELFDFDNTTGIVSHDLMLDSYIGASSGSYGVEFSPDGTKLYGTVITPGYIYQWDVDAGSDPAIIASKTLVGTSAVNFNGAVQLASDGKIYMAELGSVWLGVINDPNEAGMACDFEDNGFQLTYGANGLGLPNYFPCFFAPLSGPPVPSLSVSNPDICEKFCVDYYDSSSNNPTSWFWEFAGASPPTSSDQNPTNICYTVPGVFDVTLTTSNANGSSTVTFPNYITVYPTPPFPVITQVNYTLTSSTAASYQWQLNAYDIPGATNQSYDVLQSGYYTVIINDANGCKNSSTVYVLISSVQDLNDGATVSISPNPSNGQFTIEFSCSGASSMNGCNNEISIEVMNMLGQVIYSNEWQAWVSGEKKEIHLCRDGRSCVSTGVYIVEIKTGDTTLKKKIMITR